MVAESGANMSETLTISSLDFQTPKQSGSDRLKVGDQQSCWNATDDDDEIRKSRG